MTGIEWTGITWNPVTGCDRISPGCDHCYALTLARRLKAMGNPKYQSDGNPITSGPGFAVTCHPAAGLTGRGGAVQGLRSPSPGTNGLVTECASPA